MKRRRTYLCVSVCLFLLVLSFTTVAQEPSPKLIDSGWLKENLSRTDVRIVDLRGDVKAYWEEHIPGAVYLYPEALRWPERGIPVKLIHPEALARLLGELGIDERTFVVVYSGAGDFHATYFLWALEYAGHKHCGVLDGGFEEWKKNAGGMTSRHFPGIEPAVYPVPSELHGNVRASLSEVQGAMNREDAVILDVRPKDVFDGSKGFWRRNGHIPGAVYRSVGDDLAGNGKWKKEKNLKKEYEAIGVTPDKTVIVMCGSGLMSSRTYFTLKHVLGYPRVKHFDGGFSEWSNVDALPVETGAGASVDVDKLLQGKCTRCHNLKRVHREKADRAGWEKIIDKMIKKGTKLTEEERSVLIEHLSSK